MSQEVLPEGVRVTEGLIVLSLIVTLMGALAHPIPPVVVTSVLLVETA